MSDPCKDVAHVPGTEPAACRTFYTSCLDTTQAKAAAREFGWRAFSPSAGPAPACSGGSSHWYVKKA